MQRVVLVLILTVISMSSAHAGQHQTTTTQSTDNVDRSAMGIAHVPTGSGYWVVGADGGVFAFNAEFHGSMGGLVLEQPVVAIAATPSRRGIGWSVVMAGVRVWGCGVLRVNGWTIVESAGCRYRRDTEWVRVLANGADGGVFAFGDASFDGCGRSSIASTTATHSPARYCTSKVDRAWS
ncbi:MAG: hypothetical protein AAGF95_07370 [Chloroflexota bacterium]